MTTYSKRVRAFEALGMTTSDAQSVADAEDMIALQAMQTAAESLSVPTPTRYERPRMIQQQALDLPAPVAERIL